MQLGEKGPVLRLAQRGGPEGALHAGLGGLEPKSGLDDHLEPIAQQVEQLLAALGGEPPALEQRSPPVLDEALDVSLRHRPGATGVGASLLAGDRLERGEDLGQRLLGEAAA